MSLPTWFRSCFASRARQITSKRTPLKRAFEELENRIVPASLYWLGAVDSNWNTLGNWGTSLASGPISDPGTVPAAGDSLFFNTAATGFNDTLATFTINNNIAGLSGLTIDIDDASATGDFAISGAAVGLTGGIVSDVVAGTATFAFGTTGITLGGAQTFASNAGTLVINNAVANGGFLLTVDGAGGTTIGGNITGLGGLTHTGTDKLILTGTNSYSGGTIIDSGANLQIGNGGAAGVISYTAPITNNGTLTFNRSDAITPGNAFAINGSGSVVQAGGGTTTLSAASNYSGTTTLNAGTLQGRNPLNTDVLEAFGSSTLNLNAGILQLRGNGTGSDKILAAGNNVVINGPVTIDTNNAGSNIQNIYAFGTLAIGASTLTMTGSNIFGISFTTVTVSGNATFNPSNNSAFIRIGNLTVSDSVDDNSTTTVTITGPNETQNARYPAITGVASDYSPTRKLAIVKSGSSRWHFNGNNTFSGGLTVDAGTLDITVSSSISGTLTLNAGTLIGRNADGAEAALNAFGTAALALNGGAVQLRVNSTSASTIVAPNNVIVGGNVSIDSNNNGSQSGRTFSFGTLSIGAHTLSVTAGNSYGLRFGAATATGNATFNPTSSALTLASLTVGNSVAASTTTTVTLGGTRDSSTITGAITDNVDDATKKLAISKTNSGVWNLTGVNTFSGGFGITSGTVTATTTTGGTFQAIGTGLITLGGGTLNLRGNGTGSNGTIAIGNDVILAASTTLTVGQASGNTGNTFEFGALNIGSNVLGFNTLTITVNNTYTTTFTGTTLAGNSTISTNASLSPLKPVNLGPITETPGGAKSFTKSGTGIVAFTGANTYTGGTIVAAGTLDVSASSTLGNNVVGNNVLVMGEGRLTLNAESNIGANQTFGFKANSAPTTSNNNGAVPVLTINHTGALPVYSGELAAGVVALNANYSTPLDQSEFGDSFLGAQGTINYSAATLAPGSDGVYRLGGGGGTLTLTDAGAVLTGADVDLVVGMLGYNGNGPSGGTGTVVLQGANDFTGTTTVNPGLTLTLGGTSGGATGSIAASSSITVTNATLNLVNTVGNANRIGDEAPVLLNRATLTMNTNGSVNSTETFGDLTIAVNATITMTTAGSRVTTLNPESLVRDGNATLLIRGTNLGGNGNTTNITRITIDDLTGLTQVGAETANTADGISSSKTLKIVPWILGDTSSGSTGTNFATYDLGAGLRPLNTAAETVPFADLNNPQQNVKDTAASDVNFGTGAITANSIALSPTANRIYAGVGGTTLNSTSGALAVITGASSLNVTLQSFDAINLGSVTQPEGIVQANTGTTNNNPGTLILASDINPALNRSLTKGGGGTVTLNTTAKSFTGSIHANAGTLNLNVASNHASINVHGGVIVIGTHIAGALGSASAPVNVFSGGNLSFNGPGGNAIPAYGGGDINLNDGGVLSLTGSNGNGPAVAFTNRLVISGNAYIDDNIGGGSGNRIVLGPITMNADSMLTTNRRSGSTNGLGAGAVSLLGNATFNTISNGGGGSTRPFVLASISGNFGITKRGAAELWLSHSAYTRGDFFLAAPSTYTGNTAIEQGAFRMGMTNALPATTTVSINSGATLDLSTGNHEITLATFSQTIAGLADGSMGAGAVVADSTGANGARTLFLAGSGNYSFSGLLLDRTSSSTATLSLVKTGTGTQTLTGSGDYTGYTSVQGGTLQLGSNSPNGGPGALGSATSAVDVGAVRLQDARVATTANIASLSGTLTVDGVALVAGDRVLVKNQSTAANNGIYVVASGSWSRAADLNEAAEFKYGNTVTVTSGDTQSGTYFSGILNPGIGDPLWTLGTPSNTASLLTSAAVTIGRNISVNFTSPGGLSTLGGSHTTGTSQFTGTISLGQTSNNPGSIFARNLTLTSASGGTVQFAGIVSDPTGLASAPGLLTKAGAGDVILSGANTYTGGTSVTAGRLLVNNPALSSGTGTGGVDVDTGGTLGGTGFISGAVTIDGTLAPGNSIGDLTITNNLLLAGVSDFEVTPGGGALGNSDKVLNTTNLTYGGTLKITPLSPTGYIEGDSWDLFNSASHSGTFLNDDDFGTSGDGINLPLLTGGLQWEFDYDDGILSVVAAPDSPSITSITPVIGPTTGGTMVVIIGSNFVDIATVTFGGVSLAFSVSGTTQISVTTIAHDAGAVNVVVTNATGESGSLGGPNDFTFAKPAVASAIVNGGPGVVLGGSTWSLAGQNSVVRQILVTFNQAVTLEPDAFIVTPVPVSINPGPGVVYVDGGAAPSSAAVTASIAATLSPSSYLVTFSGPGTHHGGIINSGVYDLTTIASKVSANGETMADDKVSTFFAIFGTINANNTMTAPPPVGYIGDGFSNAFVDPGGLFRFSDTFGSNATAPAGPPAYDIVFDFNLDGSIDPGDLFAFSDSFGIDWTF